MTPQDFIKASVDLTKPIGLLKESAWEDPNDSIDLGWGFGGTAGTNVLAGPQGGFLQGLYGQLTKDQWQESTPDHAGYTKKLRRFSHMKGTPVGYGMDLDDIKSKAPVGREAPTAYFPNENKINVRWEQNHPSILAHEVGHLKGGKLLGILNSLGKTGIGLGTLGASFSGKEDTSHNWALGGSLASIPTLASELDASRRGYGMMRRLGAGRGTAAKAFLGIPTYAMAALSPLLAHHAKKGLGGFDDSE